MLSTESQASSQQQQQSAAYDERVFNERIRQLFNSIDSSSLSQSPLSPKGDTGTMTSIVDALFPEQASLHQQQKQRDQQRHASTNDLTAAFERFPLWSDAPTTSINSSASAFCGGTMTGSSAFANRRQSKLHSSSRSLRNATFQNQQGQHHYRAPPQTRPRFTSSTIRLPSAAATTIPMVNGSNNLQRSSSTLSTNNGTAEYQPRFASRLSSTRLPTATSSTSIVPPVGSYDHIACNANSIDPIAPPSVSAALGLMGQQPSSATAVLARSTSSSNAQPQQYVTMTQTTTTTFCYLPASASLAYNTLPGANRNAATAAVPHH